MRGCSDLCEALAHRHIFIDLERSKLASLGATLIVRALHLLRRLLRPRRSGAMLFQNLQEHRMLTFNLAMLSSP